LGQTRTRSFSALLGNPFGNEKDDVLDYCLLTYLSTPLFGFGSAALGGVAPIMANHEIPELLIPVRGLDFKFI